MDDFQSLWAQATNQKFDDPKKQKEFERSRLNTLTTSAVTHAMWLASAKRVLFMIFGFLFVPTAFFHLAASFVDANDASMVGLVGLSAYAFGAVLVYFIGTRIIESDPDEHLPNTIKPLLAAEAEFKKKWGNRA